uniref:CT099 n=1 Tax=Angiostrongylus cantonensis TaxID=6313 RepID=A0A0K0D8Y9_ANGCA
LTSTGELIPLGEAKSVDGDEMECKTDATGKPVLEAVEKPMEAKCKDSRGRERDLGSEWTVGWFQFKCAEGGEVVLSGCFTLSGKLILKGERGTEDGRDLECKVDEKGSPFLDVLGKSSGTKCKDGEGKYRIQGNLSIIYSLVLVPRLVLSLGW